MDEQKGVTWDIEKGWGHSFTKHDGYELIGVTKQKRGWDFPGAHGDEGLLYNWVKYEKKAVSIVMQDTIQSWGVGQDGKLVLESTVNLPDEHVFHNDRSVPYTCWNGTVAQKPCIPPHSDYFHFSGDTKPWLSGPPPDLSNKICI